MRIYEQSDNGYYPYLENQLLKKALKKLWDITKAQEKRIAQLLEHTDG